MAFDANLFYELGSIVFCAMICCVITLIVLIHYTKKGRLSIGIYLVLYITYFFNFFSLALVSIDVSTGNYFKKEDSASKVYFEIIWRIVYWSIQFLSWIVIPLCQSYVETGEFTILRKLWASLKENLILYGILGVIGVVAVTALSIYLAIKQQFQVSMIIALGINLSNAFGLLLLTWFLGHGIVAWPKFLWNKGNNVRKLRRYQYDVVQLDETVYETEHTVRELMKTVKALDYRVDANDPLRPQVDGIVKTSAQVMNDLGLSQMDGNLPTVLTHHYLVGLHKTVIKALWAFNKANYQMEQLINKAIFLEEILESEKAEEKIIISTLRERKEGFFWRLYYPLEWFYYCKLRIYSYRGVTVFFILYAALMMFCQLTSPLLQFTNVNISPFYYLILGVTILNVRIFTQFFSFTIIGCMTMIIFFSLFHFKLFHFYQLIPAHTDASSMLFLAVFMCRIVPTLCFNYLQILGVNASNDIAYFTVYGQALQLDGQPILGDVFRIFANFTPLIMLVIAFFTLFNITKRVGKLLRIKQYQFDDDPNVPDETVEEGQELISREKQRRIDEQTKWNVGSSKHYYKSGGESQSRHLLRSSPILPAKTSYSQSWQNDL